MDDNVDRIMKIYQKHRMMADMSLCCSSDHPCDMMKLFEEIKRLNGQIATLNAIVEGLALAQ